MKKSPIHPKYEAVDYGDYGFDPQVDFSEFLEEARKHACKENSDSVTPYPEGKKQLAEAKKNKKSWKRSLFSWWKTDKRNNPNSMEAPTNSDHISNPRRGYVSGPIYGSGGGGGGSCKPRRPTSGPLTSLFHPKKRVENEMPYMCLDQISNPHGVQSYGPVYLVT